MYQSQCTDFPCRFRGQYSSTRLPSYNDQARTPSSIGDQPKSSRGYESEQHRIFSVAKPTTLLHPDDPSSLRGKKYAGETLYQVLMPDVRAGGQKANSVQQELDRFVQHNLEPSWFSDEPSSKSHNGPSEMDKNTAMRYAEIYFAHIVTPASCVLLQCWLTTKNQRWQTDLTSGSVVLTSSSEVSSRLEH